MPTIEDLFHLHTADAAGYSSYAPGDVAFVTNGFSDNGVLGFVKPRAKDTVFEFLGIAVSAFCEATVQIPPFIARGNGGSGLIVLQPRWKATTEQLGYYAAYINANLKWRFSWSRLATVDRIKRLALPAKSQASVKFDVKGRLPPSTKSPKPTWTLNLAPFALNELFDLKAGDYHNAGELKKGSTPLVSCGDANNGIMRLVSAPKKHVYSNKLTIAFNGMNTLTTKYHPYQFAAKDDVAICTPRSPLKLTTLIFVQLMMDRERWRYSYYRKCFMDKLKRQSVLLPTKNGKPDEATMEKVIRSTSYWQSLEHQLTQGVGV